MDPSFTVQRQYPSPALVLPLLRGLKKVLKETDCEYGAVYETVAGPFSLGMRYSESNNDSMPVLSLLAEPSQRSDDRKTRQGTRKRLAADLSRSLEQSWASKEKFQADDLEPLHTFVGRNGPHSAAVATYIIHIDILGDAAAHHALHWIGESNFDRIPGWLSESLFRVSAAPEGSKSPTFSSPGGRQARYICIEAYDFRTDPNELAKLLQTIRNDPRRGSGVGPKCRMRVYKQFGSVGSQELFMR